MRAFSILMLMAFAAAPSHAAPNKPSDLHEVAVPADRLFPEIAVSDEGWRGLLPVILLNPDEVGGPNATADRSQPTGNN